MNRIMILLIGLCIQGQFIYAQNTDTYEIIGVPETFSFLKEPNQHELNALTAFLFEKYGFEALYLEQIPGHFQGCDILQANVENNSGLFVTRLRVVLRNCADEVIFTSEEGKSREKDYKTAYHAALRDAFKSLEGVQLRKNHSHHLGDRAPVANGTKVAGESSGTEAGQGDNIPAAVIKYLNGTTLYSLKKISSGYKLYREGEDESFATLLKSNTGDYFIYTSEPIQGTAVFDEDQNLIVEYLDRNSGQLLSLKYSIKD